ncbi:MAG TPA: IS110 family transposase, partial [Myxococcota bacterium]|nr:IS110 family transposase [Myxococcota bacterium]
LAVSIQVDGARPLRPQVMRREQLLTVVRAVLKAGRKVQVCYETGPCGYGLHFALEEAGATSYVIVAEVLADGRRQKTDKLDAAALCDKLDRYLRGNAKAMTPVRVPSLEEQRRRSEGRLREQLKKSRHEWEARGRSLLLFYGHHVTGKWWTSRRWTELKEGLAAWLVAQLEVMRASILQLDEQERKLRQTLEATAPKALPKAIGALTWVMLLREICDWKRFNNRRQVSSFSGLCPGVHQSGGRRREGSINRYGNPRVRALLIELVWRLARWQPDYPPVKALVAGVARGAARRKCAVAAARRLAVDLWRLATHQTTPEKLKLIVPTEVLA